MRESITKFLDNNTGTLCERIRNLSKEQSVTIVSILMDLGMTLGVLTEALLGGPSVSTSASGSTSGDKKGSILSWILNRAKEVIGWLSQNLWEHLTSVGVLIYTYFMTQARRK